MNEISKELRQFAVTGGHWPGGSLAALQTALKIAEAAESANAALLKRAEENRMEILKYLGENSTLRNRAIIANCERDTAEKRAEDAERELSKTQALLRVAHEMVAGAAKGDA